MITRRLFVGAIAAACVPGDRLVLEAIAAEKMPQRLIVHGVAPAEFFESRDYGQLGSQVMDVLARRGIRAVFRDDGRLLFPFESLAEREIAWRRLSTDPEWISIGSTVCLKEIAIYRCA